MTARALGQMGGGDDRTGAPVRWVNFKQQIRAYRPSALLRLIAAESAQHFDGLPLKLNPAGLQPWALAAIARESLAYGSEYRHGRIGADTLARLHALYEDLEDPFLREDGDGPWDWFIRTAHEQLPLQDGMYSPLARFAALLDRDYDDDYEVMSRAMIADLLGADPRVYSGASILFTVATMRNSGRFDLAWLEQPQFAEVVAQIPAEELRRTFLGCFGAPFAFVPIEPVAAGTRIQGCGVMTPIRSWPLLMCK